MLGLPLAFTAPFVLAALVLLPVLYFLLRITPPRPRQVPFPPLRLILDLQPMDETPARTPWWLLVLRLSLAGLLILAMAGPIWNPPPVSRQTTGPLLVMIDDGWAAAPSFDERIAVATERVASAGRDGRASAVMAMSEGAREITPGDAARTIERLRALKPAPYEPDRLMTFPAISAFLAANSRTELVWISDGLELGNARTFAAALADWSKDGPAVVLRDAHAIFALAGAESTSAALNVRVLRSEGSGSEQGAVRGLDLKGLSIAEAHFNLNAAKETNARFELPVELRNEIARVEIAGEHSAGAVALLDERWKRRRVGLVSGATADVAQPLLSPTYYLNKALTPFADVRETRIGTADPIAELIDENVATLILADVGIVSGASHDRLARFVEDGGVLLRFAGARLAGASDDLVPVRLRRGGRTLGGSLSWDTPKKLARFEQDSPFFGLDVPQEVTVTRQVLAEPEAGLPTKTWAQLADGTPLVTAARQGKGLLVLIHVTADTTWSNLPLSGLFVDMLRRIVAMSVVGQPQSADADKGIAATAEARAIASVAPTRTLDGFGVLGAPPATAKPIPANYDGFANADHPPGFYGPPDALVAVNTLSPATRLESADLTGLNLEGQALKAAEPIDLRVWLIVICFFALLADALASMWLSGGLRRRPQRATETALVLALAFCAAQVLWSSRTAEAQESSQATTMRDIESALTTRLAYVASGDAQVDDASRLGLLSLSHALANRTSLAPGDPVGVDPARDELAFYPLLYWPIVATTPQPASAAVAKIAAFMKQGGTIVFDTRDALSSRPGGPATPEARWLRQLLAGVDVPELELIPRDHVVTKTFYLIDGFVGRYTIGETWIEALPPVSADDVNRPARAGDSVSPIIVTSNDLAAGWATDRNGEPLYPLVPGGSRQRELSLRGGVNLVMYTLTGNYKADQVHVRDLLERLAH